MDVPPPNGLACRPGIPMTSEPAGARWEIRHDFSASFTTDLLRRLGTALHCQCGADDRLVYVHVSHGRDVDARRLDDVDGVDADAWTDVARCGGVVHGHVGGDDGGDDAALFSPNAMALPPSARQHKQDPSRSAN